MAAAGTMDVEAEQKAKLKAELKAERKAKWKAERSLALQPAQRAVPPEAKAAPRLELDIDLNEVPYRARAELTKKKFADELFKACGGKAKKKGG